MSRRLYMRYFFKTWRHLGKRKQKRLQRKTTYSRYNLARGLAVVQKRSLLHNGFFFFVQHTIKQGNKFKQVLMILRVFAIIKVVLKMGMDQFFMYLFRRITPMIKFLPKTFGRTVYKIPVKANIPFNLHKAVHKLVKFSRLRNEETLALKLAGECFQSIHLKSRTIKWKQSVHLEAFENRENLTYLRYY